MDKQNRINGIYVPLKVGDIIYTGRFKNKKTTVKTIGVDEYGMPTVNGKRAMTFRILPKDLGDKKNWVTFVKILYDGTSELK